MLAIGSLLVIVLMILVTARIATVALVATGLPQEVARFQARSALTGVGFTTSESETVVGHPIRRRIVMVLMLVGNAGLVSIVASVILSFSANPSTQQVLIRLGAAGVGVALIGAVAHSGAFERRLTALIARMVDRFTDLQLRDYHHLLQLSNEYAVTELYVAPGDWLADKSLTDLELPNEGVLVLAVQRSSGEFIGAPRGPTVIHPRDTIVLYGRASVLSDLDVRPATPEGDHAHSDAVAEQHILMTQEGDSDRGVD